MKSRLTFLIAAAALAAGGLSAAETENKATDRIDVQFRNPENFTDVKDSYMGTDRGRDAYLRLIKDYIQSRAPRLLAEGQQLSIVFTDIDLAGDFEPQHGPSAQDIRIMKAIYPPRLKFDYRVVDAQGVLVKEGHASLSDLDYQNSLSTILDRSDELRFEKPLLDRWMRAELRTKK